MDSSNLSPPDNDIDHDNDYEDDDDDNDNNDKSSAESEPMDFIYDVEETEDNNIQLSNRSYQLQRLQKVKSLEEVSSDYSSPAFSRTKSKSFDLLDDETESGLTLTVELEHSPGSMSSKLDKFHKELAAKDALITELTSQNRDLILQTGTVTDENVNEQLKTQTRLVSELMLECSKKNSEINHLKAVEKSFKQTKQVLKDTTWTLKVREEELKNIKSEMRENYEKRLNELMIRLNEREIKLTTARNENNILAEAEKDANLRIQELMKQINLLREEMDVKNAEIKDHKGYLEELKLANTSLKEELSKEGEAMVSSAITQTEVDNEYMNNEKQEWMKEKENFLMLLQEKNDTMLSKEERYQIEVSRLHNEIAKGKKQISELCAMLEGVSTNSDQLPTMQVDIAAQAPVEQYLLKKTERDIDDDSFEDIDDLNSQCEDVLSKSEGDLSEGRTALQRQMSHTIETYEGQIKELQSLYDQDVFLLEKENKDLKMQVTNLKGMYDDINNAKSMSNLNTEDLKYSYEEKLKEMKEYYESLLMQKENSVNETNVNLKSENEQLRTDILDVEKKYTELFQATQDRFEETLHNEMQEEIQSILGEQHQNMLLIHQQLHKELGDIKSLHTDQLELVGKVYNDEKLTKESLDDTYSNQLLKLQEDKNIAENDVSALKAELLSLQREYESLKQRYSVMEESVDAFGFENNKYKEEIKTLHEKCATLTDENKVLDADLSMRDVQISKYKSDVRELNNSVLELQAGIENEIKPESPRKKRHITERGHALHEEILVLRANLDDAKSDVKSLLCEREKFESLSSTLNDELRKLQSRLEEQSRIDQTLKSETKRPICYSVEEIPVEAVYAEPVEAVMDESFLLSFEGSDEENMTESMFLPEHESTADYDFCQNELCVKTNEYAKSLQDEVENLNEKIKMLEEQYEKKKSMVADNEDIKVLKEKLSTKDQAGMQLQETFSRQLLESQNKNAELLQQIEKLGKEKTEYLREKDVLKDSYEKDRIRFVGVKRENSDLKANLEEVIKSLAETQKKLGLKSEILEKVENQLQVEKEEIRKLQKKIEDGAQVKEELEQERMLCQKVRKKLTETQEELDEVTASVDTLSKSAEEKSDNENKLLEQNKNLKEKLDNSMEKNRRDEEEHAKDKKELLTALKNKDLDIENFKTELKKKDSEIILLDNRLKSEFEDTLRLLKEQMTLANQESLSILRADLDRDHQSRIEVIQEQLHQEYGEEMEMLRAEYNLKVGQLKTDHVEEKKELREKLEQEQRQLLETLKETDEKIRSKDMTTLQEEHAKELQSLQLALEMEHKEMESRLKKRAVEEQSKKIKELETLFEKSKAEDADSLKVHYEDVLEKELQNLKDYYETEMDKDNQTHELALKDLKNKLKKTYDEEYDKKLNDLKQQHEEDKDVYRKAMEEKLQLLKNDSSETIKTVMKSKEDELNRSFEKRLASHKELLVEKEDKIQDQLNREEVLKNEIAELCEELENMKTFYEKQTLLKLSEIQKEFEDEQREKEKQHADEISKLQQLTDKLQEQLSRLELDHRSEITNLKELHDAEITDGRNNFASRLEDELITLKQEQDAEFINLKEKNQKVVDKLKADMNNEIEQLKANQSSALERETYKHELQLHNLNWNLLDELAEAHTQMLLRNSQKIILEQEKYEQKLQEMQEQINDEHSSQIGLLKISHEKEVAMLLEQISQLHAAKEMNSDDQNYADSLEESIERIANDYVVLAINNSQDVINANEEERQNISTLMTTPVKSKRKKVVKQPGSPVKEDVYNISCSYETFSEESVVVNVRDWYTQTEVIGTELKNEVDKLNAEVNSRTNEIETLHAEIADIQKNFDGKVVEWKEKIALLEDHLQQAKKENADQEEHMVQVKTFHNEELSHLQEQIEFERKMKSANEESLRNAVEDAKMEMMKQHQNLLNEFVKEQEKEMDELEHDQAKQLEHIEGEHIRDVKMLGNKVKEKLIAEFLHVPAEEQNNRKNDSPAEIKEGVLIKSLDDDLKAVIDLVQAEQSKKLNIARDHVREEIEKEHLESLSELEKCLQQKHVEQLEKLAEFQKQHVQEVAELKHENDKKVQGIIDKYEYQITTLKAEIVQLDQQNKMHGKNIEDLETAHQQEMEYLEKKLKEAASQFETEENMKAYISKMTNESLNTIQKQHDEEMKQLKDSLSQSNEAQLKHLKKIIKLHEPTERSDVAEIVKQLEDMKNMVQNTNYSEQLSDSIEKNQDELLKELEVRQATIKKLEMENSNLKSTLESSVFSHNQLKEKLKEYEMHAESLLQRHDRQEDESSNLVKMLQHELNDITEDRNQLKINNVSLSNSLTDMVKSVVKVEDLIHHKIDKLITEHATARDSSQTNIFADLALEGHEPNEFSKSLLDISDYSLKQTTVDLDDEEPAGVDMSAFILENAKAIEEIPKRLNVVVEQLLQLLNVTTQELQENHSAYEQLSTAHESATEVTRKLEHEKETLAEQLAAVESDFANIESIIPTMEEQIQELQNLNENVAEKNEELLTEVEAKDQEIANLHDQISKAAELYENLEAESKAAKEKMLKCEKQLEESNLKFHDEREQNKCLMDAKRKKEIEIAELKTELENERYARKQEDIAFPRKISKSSFDVDQENEKMKEEILALHQVIEEMTTEFKANQKKLLAERASSELVSKTEEALCKKNNDLQKLQAETLQKNEELSTALDEKHEEVAEVKVQLAKANENYLQSEMECAELKEALTKFSEQIKEFQVKFDDELQKRENLEHVNKEKEKEVVEKEKEVAKLKTELSEERAKRDEEGILLKQSSNDMVESENEKTRLRDAVRALKENVEQFEVEKVNHDNKIAELKDKLEAELSARSKDAVLFKQSSNDLLNALNEKAKLKDEIQALQQNMKQLKEEKMQQETELRNLQNQLGKENSERNKEILLMKQSCKDMLNFAQENEQLKEEVKTLNQALEQLSEEKKDLYTQLIDSGFPVTDGISSLHSTAISNPAKDAQLTSTNKHGSQDDNSLSDERTYTKENEDILRDNEDNLEHTPYSSLLQQSDSITIENLDTYSVSSQRTELNVDQLPATDSVMQHLQAMQDVLNKNIDRIFDENELLVARDVIGQLDEFILHSNPEKHSGKQHDAEKHSKMKMLLSDLQKEADDVLDLVLNDPGATGVVSIDVVRNMQGEWREEKENLMAIINSLKDIIALFKGNPKGKKSPSNARRKRQDLIEAVKKYFEKEQEALLSENNQSKHRVKVEQNALVEDLKQEDRNMLIEEILSLQGTLKECKHDNQLLLDNVQQLQEVTETSVSELKAQELKHQHLLKDKLHLDGRVADLLKLLNQEEAKADQATSELSKEKSKCKDLEDQLEDVEAEVNRLQQTLQNEQKGLSELISQDRGIVTNLENMLQEEIRKNDSLKDRLKSAVNENNKNKELLHSQEDQLTAATLQQKRFAALLAREKDEKASMKTALVREQDEKPSMRSALEKAETENELLRSDLAREKDEKASLKSVLASERQKYFKFKDMMMNKDKETQEKLQHAEDVLNNMRKGADEKEDMRSRHERDLCSKIRQLEALNRNLQEQISGMQGVACQSEKTMKSKIDILENINKSLQNDVDEMEMCFVDGSSHPLNNNAKPSRNGSSFHESYAPEDEQRPEKEELSGDGKRLVKAGWTIAKVQRLYLKYFRAESFRKALAYQKRYLLLVLKENGKAEQFSSPFNTPLSLSTKRNSRFKVLAFAVVAINRMKYLVRKYQHNLRKSSPEYQYKDSRHKPHRTPDTDKSIQHRPRYSEATTLQKSPVQNTNKNWHYKSDISKTRDKDSHLRTHSPASMYLPLGSSRPTLSATSASSMLDNQRSNYSSPPRSYPRPLRGENAQKEYSDHNTDTSSRSPHSPRGTYTEKQIAEMSSGTNTSLNKYIDKLEALRLRLQTHSR
ncbi:centrosomal protein of 290 kDa-like isoform X2 [Hydractinia symbiolongicarpus]|uniref:centrosomal protein of 290 kDa-like isoform X2 n=1 Tax=Hydractinia symbiolongicarpus TaxID=13093 RepID=UPI00254E58EC|nr:centrosomal protein of 290 kDa-like isoform X2 [Hydractinia symbiolongicarpus]